MPRIVLRPAAEVDLSDIYQYISEVSGSRETAIAYVRRMREWCDQLLVFPKAGRARDELRPGVRIIAFAGRVVIAYVILPSGDVEIGRFFYGGRIRGDHQRGTVATGKVGGLTRGRRAMTGPEQAARRSEWLRTSEW